MRMTGQRRVVARVLSESEDHPDVEEIYKRAERLDPQISIATVYRTLRLFDAANVIDRLEFGDGRARYEISSDETHHYHLIDIKTGKVIEFENEEVDKRLQEIANQLGYRLIGDRLDLYGTALEPSEKDQKP
ncbi:MAG: Fur family transcriptional regulator [Rhodospirillaceae bacterium]